MKETRPASWPVFPMTLNGIYRAIFITKGWISGKEIGTDAFAGSPAITNFRMTEDGDVVIAEGAVQCTMRNGFVPDALFCDVFEMWKCKLKKLISCQVNKEQAT